MDGHWIGLRALEGQTIDTTRKKPFTVVSVDDDRSGWTVIRVESTGRLRLIRRNEVDRARALAGAGGEMSPRAIQLSGASSWNSAYVAALLRELARQG